MDDSNSQVEGSPNLIQGDESAGKQQKERVEELLSQRPDLSRAPAKIADSLHIPRGSAKRILKEIRDSQRLPSFGPVLLQNVRIVGRTDPGGTSLGSPPMSAIGMWHDRGDNKLTATVDIPHLEGKAEVSVSGTTLELMLSSPRGFTPSEVLLALQLLRLPFDRTQDVSISQLEVFRDGATARFEGVEARTYRNAEGLITKFYNHSDSRGTVARMEVRPPAMKLSWEELEAFLKGKPPMGRDAKIEALTAMVEDNSRGLVDLKREIRSVKNIIAEWAGSGQVRMKSRRKPADGSLNGSPGDYFTPGDKIQQTSRDRVTNER